jgi:hypothetical protein
LELFDLLFRIGPLQGHIGLAWSRPEAERDEQEPPGPMPHLEPLEPPMPVVIDDDCDPDLLRQRIGFRVSGDQSGG